MRKHREARSRISRSSTEGRLTHNAKHKKRPKHNTHTHTHTHTHEHKRKHTTTKQNLNQTPKHGRQNTDRRERVTTALIPSPGTHHFFFSFEITFWEWSMSRCSPTFSTPTHASPPPSGPAGWAGSRLPRRNLD